MFLEDLGNLKFRPILLLMTSQIDWLLYFCLSILIMDSNLLSFYNQFVTYMFMNMSMFLQIGVHQFVVKVYIAYFLSNYFIQLY